MDLAVLVERSDVLKDNCDRRPNLPEHGVLQFQEQVPLKLMTLVTQTISCCLPSRLPLSFQHPLVTLLLVPSGEPVTTERCARRNDDRQSC